MTTIEHAAAAIAPSGARFTALRTMLVALVSIVRAFRNRRAVLHVAELPDELLKDIGLKRDDIHPAQQVGWREDPSYRLALDAATRRHRQIFGE